MQTCAGGKRKLSKFDNLQCMKLRRRYRNQCIKSLCMHVMESLFLGTVRHNLYRMSSFWLNFGEKVHTSVSKDYFQALCVTTCTIWTHSGCIFGAWTLDVKRKNPDRLSSSLGTAHLYSLLMYSAGISWPCCMAAHTTSEGRGNLATKKEFHGDENLRWGFFPRWHVFLTHSSCTCMARVCGPNRRRASHVRNLTLKCKENRSKLDTWRIGSSPFRTAYSSSCLDALDRASVKPLHKSPGLLNFERGLRDLDALRSSRLRPATAEV